VGTTQLRDQPRLLILRERAGNLAHHDPRGVAGVRQIIAVRIEHPHAPLDQQKHAQLLRDKITGEAACVFHDDRADAVAFKTVQECREAWANLEGVGAADSRVVKTIDDSRAGALRERLVRLIGGLTIS
jgi:hypothetical protein